MKFKDISAQGSSISSIFSDMDYYRFTWQDFMNLPQANDTINLSSPSYSLLNAAVFFVTNRIRMQHGLHVLNFSPELKEMAQYHSQSMATNSFVAHENPYDRRMATVNKRSTAFQADAAGENVASTFLAQYSRNFGDPLNYYRVWENNRYVFYTDDGFRIPDHTYLSLAEQVVNNWMNSPGHRRNILEPRFKRLGCAVAINPKDVNNGSIGLAYCTQNFGN